MKEKYETNAKTAFRIVVTIQNGTDIRHANLWIAKQMLEDVYREQGLTAFRRKVRESLGELTNWASLEIHDCFGFIGMPEPKRRWWKFW